MRDRRRRRRASRPAARIFTSGQTSLMNQRIAGSFGRVIHHSAEHDPGRSDGAATGRSRSSSTPLAITCTLAEGASERAIDASRSLTTSVVTAAAAARASKAPSVRGFAAVDPRLRRTACSGHVAPLPRIDVDEVEHNGMPASGGCMAKRAMPEQYAKTTIGRAGVADLRAA